MHAGMDPSLASHPEQESGEHEWIALSSNSRNLTRPLSGHKSLVLISRLLRFRVELPAAANIPDTHLCRWGPPWWWPACIYHSSWPSWMASAWRCVCGRPPARRAEGRRGRKRDQERVGWTDASRSAANRNTFGIQQWYIRLWLHTGVWSEPLMAFGFSWPVHLCLCYIECFSSSHLDSLFFVRNIDFVLSYLVLSLG